MSGLSEYLIILGAGATAAIADLPTAANFFSENEEWKSCREDDYPHLSVAYKLLKEETNGEVKALLARDLEAAKTPKQNKLIFRKCHGRKPVGIYIHFRLLKAADFGTMFIAILKQDRGRAQTRL